MLRSQAIGFHSYLCILQGFFSSTDITQLVHYREVARSDFVYYVYGTCVSVTSVYVCLWVYDLYEIVCFLFFVCESINVDC